jgi:hypothetical protein
MGLLMGFLCSMAMHIEDRPQLVERQKPTDVINAHPMNISLKIMSDRDFQRDPNALNLMKTQKMAAIAAYTVMSASPCTIALPDDFKINFIAESGLAWFNDPETSDSLAHEILHCLHGSWHPPWDKINQAQSTSKRVPFAASSSSR